MPRTKNVSAPGGGDDEDPRRPFRQVKGKTVYLEQQEGRKKRRTDRAARAAAAAAAAAAQAELGDQSQTPSDQIAYRVRRLASRRSSTHTSASTPPPTLPAPVTPVAPSTTTSIPATSTTPASTAPPPLAPASAPPVPPPRFWERDETDVRPLAADPRLFDLQRATAARVRRFRYVPVESWLPVQRDPAAVDLFSTRIQESFFRAQMSAQIALRVHRLLDLPAFLLAAGADSEAHLTYLPGLMTLLTTSGRYVEEWVRVFYASVWIDPDHHWMRFRFEREDVTITASQIRQLFGFPESTTRLHSLCYGTSDPPRRPHGGVAPGTAHVAALFRPPFTDGSRRSPADFTTAAKYLYELIRRTLLPRMGYREATTHIQLWLLGALVSHSEFDVVDFLICEIEDTVLDGIRARRQLPYAHYLCHIFAQLIQPPRFQGTLEASRLVFGSYRPAPETPVPASAPVLTLRPRMQLFISSTLRLHQLLLLMMMMILGFLFRLLCLHAHMIMRLGVLVLPLLPLQLWTLLLLRFSNLSLSSRLTWQPSRPGYPRGCSRCFRTCRIGRMRFSSSYFKIGLRAGHSWLLCYSSLVSQYLRFSLLHLLRFTLQLCHRFFQDPLLVLLRSGRSLWRSPLRFSALSARSHQCHQHLLLPLLLWQYL
jgi:hypothetical protein